MILDPKAIGAQLAYQVLTTALVPRPIGFISSISADGVVNLAPFSFFNAICAEPPMVMFSVSNRTPPKDTLVNVKATGEFVVNIVDEQIAQHMNLTAGEYAAGLNEFEIAGLTALPSDLVRPPRVAESPVNMECRVTQVVEVSSLPLGGTVVMGEVVRFHVRDSIIGKDLMIDADRLNPIARMGGTNYIRSRDRFAMNRPIVSK